MFLKVSHDEKKIGMLIGKKLIKNNIQVTELLIYRQTKEKQWEKQIQMNYNFTSFTCALFAFKKSDANKVLMFTNDSIIEVNYGASANKKGSREQKERVLKNFGNMMKDPPSYGTFSVDQTKAIIASANDALYVDIDTGFELDIDEKENIGDILNTYADAKKFYVITNKKDNVLGYYVFIIDTTKPNAEYEYIIKWTNKLSISGVDLSMMRCKNTNKAHRLVVSFKCEGINTYNIFVFDINTKLLTFWYEVY